jgi:hypothetical protein
VGVRARRWGDVEAGQVGDLHVGEQRRHRAVRLAVGVVLHGSLTTLSEVLQLQPERQKKKKKQQVSVQSWTTN